jgi:hypothetical protein
MDFEMDTLPIEDIIGESILQKSPYEILNPYKAKALIKLAASLPIVDSPAQDMEGTNQIRALAESWDKKTTESRSKLERKYQLERGGNIDPLDIPTPKVLTQAVKHTEEIRIFDLKEKMAEAEQQITEYSIMEESGTVVIQQSPVPEDDSDDDMRPIPPLSNIEIRNITQIDPDDIRLQPVKVYSPLKSQQVGGQPATLEHILEHILQRTMKSERLLLEMMASVKSITAELKSMSGILSATNDMFNDFKTASLNMQQYNANVVALFTQLMTTLKSSGPSTQYIQQPTVLSPHTTSIAQENTVGDHDPTRKALVQKFSHYYEANIANKSLKNLTKDLYVKMMINGGFRKYMNENFKDHTVPEHTFSNLEKGGFLYAYGVIDRELERLLSSGHKSQYISIPQNVALYTPIIRQPVFASTSAVSVQTLQSMSDDEYYKRLGI